MCCGSILSASLSLHFVLFPVRIGSDVAEFVHNDDTLDAINPDELEVWYDGTDTDCSGGSDYDADGATFASDAYGGTDCNDAVDTTYTGATEVWYDGVDADCAGDSDYDADGDTFDSDAHGGTDCDDTLDTTYTGATETWYDGVDADCAGDSDDDADGDGFDSDSHGGTDCDDAVATTYPGATESGRDAGRVGGPRRGRRGRCSVRSLRLAGCCSSRTQRCTSRLAPYCCKARRGAWR